MQPIKILLFAPIWKREKTVRAHMENMERLMMWDKSRYNITTLYVVSNEQDKAICDEYAMQSYFHENLPIGRKLNAALKSVAHLEFDFLIGMGSDNFIEPSILDEYLPYFEVCGAFGLNTCYAIEQSTGNQKEMMIGYPYGAMRCIRWSIVQQMNGELWMEMDNRGLDYYSMINVQEKTGIDFQVVYSQAKLWDVKNESNINTFKKTGGNQIEVTTDEMPIELQQLLGTCHSTLNETY